MARYTDESKFLSSDGWGRWVQPVEKGYKMACCDCGLVHTVDFRVDEDGRVQLRMKRNNRSTALVRRHNNIKVAKSYDGG